MSEGTDGQNTPEKKPEVSLPADEKTVAGKDATEWLAAGMEGKTPEEIAEKKAEIADIKAAAETVSAATNGNGNGGASAKEADVKDAKDVSPGSNDDAKNPFVTAGAQKDDGKLVVKKASGKKKKDVEIAVRVTNVTKRFGVKTAVDGVNIKIKAGLVYGLIGPNGAGKTTTFSMMAGYLKPTEGVIEMLGYAPTAIDELRSRVGVLPQDAILPAYDKVGEFLVHMARLQDIPKDKAESSAREVLAEVDGRDWWNVRCGSLSHGMAKRVQLAQAIMGEPEVVLLDEPTAGLDPRIAYEVRQLIKSRRGRCTLIVSSHNLQELEEICDAAVILDRGRVIAQGSINELTASSEEIRIKLSPHTVANAGQQPPPLSAAIGAVRDLPMVKRVEFDEEKYELVVYFERKAVDAETVIGAALWVLLNHRARVSGVTKGRGLEQRVMELT